MKIEMDLPKNPVLLESKKRMLEQGFDESRNKNYVKINYSSLDIIQTCLRKAKYALNDELIKNIESPALTAGKAVHQALEVWYCAEHSHRKIGSVQCDDNQMAMLNGMELMENHPHCARCSSIFSLLKNVHGKLSSLDSPRSPENLMDIMNNYFDNYLEDRLVVMHDDLGPICERHAEELIYETPTLDIYLHGTVDCVLQNSETKEIYITDHKTTSSLGADFLNRIKPNFQYIGYWYLARQALGLDTNLFMVNGIQVAKTVQKLERQIVTIFEEDFQELKRALVWHVRNYLAAQEQNYWPMATPNPCSMWGGCNFKNLCEISTGNPVETEKLRASIIEAEYSRGE